MKAEHSAYKLQYYKGRVQRHRNSFKARAQWPRNVMKAEHSGLEKGGENS